MKLGIMILAATVLFMMAGALPFIKAEADPVLVFQSPVFTGLLFLLAGSLFYCCWKRRSMSSRGLVFAIVHLSVILILLGAFLRFLKEEKFNIYVPVGVEQPAVRIDEKNNYVDPGFGFDVFATEFKIDYFEPEEYDLYLIDSTNPDAEPELLKSFRIKGADEFDLGEYGTVNLEDLRDPDGIEGWKAHYRAGDSAVLSLTEPAVRRYYAKLLFSGGEDGLEKEAETEINKPVTHGGWRFYFLSFDRPMKRYIVLTARRDPGRILVISGIWLLIVSITVYCWFMAGDKRKYAAGEKREEKDKVEASAT